MCIFSQTYHPLSYFVIFQGILAEYKWLTGGVEFVSEIPKLPSGKILRHELREMALQSA